MEVAFLCVLFKNLIKLVLMWIIRNQSTCLLFATPLRSINLCEKSSDTLVET
jgi:hypothetical protein